MRKLLMMIAVVSLAAACGKKQAPAAPSTEPAKDTPVANGVACDKEIAMQCPEGQIDGCLKTPAEGTTHACVAK